MLTNKPLLGIAFLTLVLLALTIFIRNDNLMPYTGEESYLNLRLADTIAADKTIPRYDPLSYGGRPLAHEMGFPLFLALLPDLFLRIIPLLLGLFCLYALARVLAYYSPHYQHLTLLLFVLSPPFLSLYTSLSKYTLALPLFLLTFLAYKKAHYTKMYLLLTLTALVSTLASILFLAILVVDLFRKKTLPRHLFFIALLAGTIFLIQHYPALTHGLPERLSFATKEQGILFLTHHFIAGVGSASGFSLFLLILGIAGIYYAYHANYRYFLYYLLAVPLFFLILFFPPLLHFTNPLLAFFATITLAHQAHGIWKSSFLKNSTFLFLSLGILSATLVFLFSLSTLPPTEGMGTAIQWLRERPDNDVAFSHYHNGVFIAYAHKKNIMDSDFLSAPNVNERWSDSQTLFHSVTLDPIEPLLEQYAIHYILIDRAAQRETWTTYERELPFLLKYGKGTFAESYTNDDVTIWEVFLGK